jgi:hypothetical protein
MHVKLIKGKKYWYTSKRVNGKVTSVYIGPVKENGKPEQIKNNEVADEEDIVDSSDDNFYVG